MTGVIRYKGEYDGYLVYHDKSRLGFVRRIGNRWEARDKPSGKIEAHGLRSRHQAAMLLLDLRLGATCATSS